MKAMVFAAGLGKRMGDLSLSTPKALVSISGKTMLRLSVEYLNANGFDDIIVNIHHLAHLVEAEIELLRKEGYRITISDEREELLETGGGLRKAAWFFENSPFLLYNVDIITTASLKEMLGFHIQHKGLATLAVANRDDDRVFLSDKTGLLCGWRNRITEETIMARPVSHSEELAFSGIHIINPEFLNYLHEGFYSLTEIYLQLAENHRIYTWRHDNEFWDTIGTITDLQRVREYFRKTTEKNS
jgi:NDP-sugar pyrophosphorylase family protein